jgi:hypothetical protein
MEDQIQNVLNPQGFAVQHSQDEVDAASTGQVVIVEGNETVEEGRIKVVTTASPMI